MAVIPTDLPRLIFWEPQRGTLETLTSVDEWEFLGASGDHITLRVVERGAPATMTLRKNGVILAEGASIEIVLVDEGRYTVEVRPAAQDVGDYEIGLGFADRSPPRELDAESAALTLPQVVGVPTPTPAYAALGSFIQQLDDGEDVGNALTNTEPQHVYTFDGQTGEYISIAMTRISGTLDPFLTLFDPEGNPVAMDDNSGPNRDARLRNIRLLDDGLYTVQATGDGFFGDYRLQLTNGFQRLVPDNAPTSEPTQPVSYATPTIGPVVSDARLADHVPVIGSLPRSGDFQRFSFEATEGELLTVRVAPYQDSSLSPQFEVFDIEGQLRAAAGASTSAAGGAALFSRIPVTESGVYSIIVTGEGETLGAFTIAVGRGVTAQDVFQGEVSSNTPVNGMLTRFGERHSWLVNLQPGDVITAALSANDPTLDPLLQIATVDGNVIAQDDNSGNDNAALIDVAEVVSPGTYVLRVLDANGRGVGAYTLLWRYINLAPTPTPQAASATILSARGEISANDYDFYVFQGLAGQTVQITVNADAASELDPVLALIDPEGQVMAEADDSDGSLNPRLTVTLPEDGSYNVRVNGYLSSGAFDLNVAIVFNTG